MSAKILIFVLVFSALNPYAQKTNPTSSNRNSQPNTDELAKHLSATETFQISGDPVNAATENQAIVGIALQRIGNIAVEEGSCSDAVKIFKQSIIYLDDAPNRTNLALLIFV